MDKILLNPPQCYEHDLLTLMDFVNHNDDDNPRPIGLFGDGEHFIDKPEGRRGANRRSQRLTLQHLAIIIIMIITTTIN